MDIYGYHNLNIESSLTDTCRQTILNFISNGPRLPAYNCQGFFLDALGIPFDDHLLGTNQFQIPGMPSQWNFKPLTKITSLEIGDGIVLGTNLVNEDPSIPTMTTFHWAIHLGKGQCVSNYGTTGALVLSTVEQMQQIWGGFAYKATFLKKIISIRLFGIEFFCRNDGAVGLSIQCTGIDRTGV